mmetsp:Transcript_22237/g.63222  ORF Transcript_22237/g.63222 Transcript_22237/m.63222 type:complete len:281 (+) Transcript_22237:2120-2962(+)
MMRRCLVRSTVLFVRVGRVSWHGNLGVTLRVRPRDSRPRGNHGEDEGLGEKVTVRHKAARNLGRGGNVPQLVQTQPHPKLALCLTRSNDGLKVAHFVHVHNGCECDEAVEAGGAGVVGEQVHEECQLDEQVEVDGDETSWAASSTSRCRHSRLRRRGVPWSGPTAIFRAEDRRCSRGGSRVPVVAELAKHSEGNGLGAEAKRRILGEAPRLKQHGIGRLQPVCRLHRVDEMAVVNIEPSGALRERGIRRQRRQRRGLGGQVASFPTVFRGRGLIVAEWPR